MAAPLTAPGPGKRPGTRRRILAGVGALGVVAIVSTAVLVSLLLFARRGPPESGENVSAVLASESTSSIGVSTPPEAGASGPTTAVPVAPPVRVRATVYRYTLKVIENTCPQRVAGTAPGTTTMFEYDLREAETASSDGYISAGEATEVRTVSSILGTYAFTYPRFDFTFAFEGARVDAHMQFENGALVSASQEQYYGSPSCSYRLSYVPASQ